MKLFNTLFLVSMLAAMAMATIVSTAPPYYSQVPVDAPNHSEKGTQTPTYSEAPAETPNHSEKGTQPPAYSEAPAEAPNHSEKGRSRGKCDGKSRNIDFTSDRNNCGKCGHKCIARKACCEGKCVNLKTNEKHCGKCGTNCTNKQTCLNGICTNTK